MSAISSLKFPFELTKDQIEAIDAWTTNGCRGSIIYSTEFDPTSYFDIVIITKRIVI
jgi:hypothetical protein